MSNKMPGCHLANAWRSRSKHILQWRYYTAMKYQFILLYHSWAYQYSHWADRGRICNGIRRYRWRWERSPWCPRRSSSSVRRPWVAWPGVTTSGCDLAPSSACSLPPPRSCRPTGSSAWSAPWRHQTSSHDRPRSRRTWARDDRDRGTASVATSLICPPVAFPAWLPPTVKQFIHAYYCTSAGLTHVMPSDVQLDAIIQQYRSNTNYVKINATSVHQCLAAILNCWIVW